MGEHKNPAVKLQRRLKREREAFLPSTKRKPIADGLMRAFRKHAGIR